MKKIILSALIVISLAIAATAEPFLTDEVKCLKAKSGEAGIQASYGIDAWTIADVTGGADYQVSVTKMEIPVKYGLTDKLQFNLLVPYVSWKYTVDPDTYDESDSDSGIGQIGAGGKYGITENIAVGINVSAPTADVDKGLGEGTNIGAMFIFSKDIEQMKLSANAGYIIKAAYEDENDNEWNPGDSIVIKAALEYPINNISLIGEAQSQMFGKYKVKPDGGQKAI